jgi:hypothetical protein
MMLVTPPAKASVESPLFTWPHANFHRGLQKHFPKMLFQHKKDWLVGWQYLGRVGRSVMRFSAAVRMSAMLTKFLYRLRYGSIRSLIFGWHMSSCPGLVFWGPVTGGAKAGVAH